MELKKSFRAKRGLLIDDFLIKKYFNMINVVEVNFFEILDFQKNWLICILFMNFRK